MSQRGVLGVAIEPVGEVLPAVRPRRGAGEALRSLVELATGLPVPSVEEDPGWQPTTLVITVPLMARLTLEALAMLRAASEAGSVRAAIHLMDRGLGAVGESFEEKARRYTLDQAREALVGELTALGLTSEQIEGYVKRALMPAPIGDGESG